MLKRVSDCVLDRVKKLFGVVKQGQKDRGIEAKSIAVGS